jgi:hypothetical protein
MLCPCHVLVDGCRFGVQGRSGQVEGREYAATQEAGIRAGRQSQSPCSRCRPKTMDWLSTQDTAPCAASGVFDAAPRERG